MEKKTYPLYQTWFSNLYHIVIMHGREYLGMKLDIWEENTHITKKRKIHVLSVCTCTRSGYLDVSATGVIQNISTLYILLHIACLEQINYSVTTIPKEHLGDIYDIWRTQLACDLQKWLPLRYLSEIINAMLIFNNIISK